MPIIHTDNFSTADGCRIAYTVHPAPHAQAPKLVLIHSLALDAGVWEGVASRLSSKAQLLTYDCRGHGQSGRPHMDYSADLFGRDLAQLLDHVGWKETAVAGCSMGGCVAQAFAGQNPGRTRALGLIDTTAWYGPEAPKTFRDRAAAAKAKGMAGLIDFQVTRWFSDGFRARHPEAMEGPTKTFLANDFDCYAASCALLGDADLRHYAAKLKMPVAIIVGEEDYATPVAMAKALHESIPQSTLKIIAGGRHLTPIECPDDIAGELTALLARP